MAGAYTHLLLSDTGRLKRPSLGTELMQLLNKHRRFLLLGSVSPDLPYLSVKTGSVKWADVMHYEKTNSTFDAGYAALKNSWYTKTEADEAKLVWLMGYVSHMVADATIHPVVQATVGDYQDHQGEHRDCEMTQDSLMFNALKDGEDIRYAEFADMVHFCKESPHFDELMGFWKGLILANYAGKGEEPHPALWFSTYSTAIDVADANSAFVGLFRHVGLGESCLYKTADEIRKSPNGEYEKYFLKVLLPGDTYGKFESVFKKAVANIIDSWKAIYTGLTLGAAPVSIVRPWNLDTGADTQAAGNPVTYWV